MQDRFKHRVKFETDGQVEIFDVTKLDMELGQVFFKRKDGQYYNVGIGCKDVELMQCAGLKDKNGKLIYEGDIVRAEEYPFKSDDVYNYSAEICWNNEGAEFFYYVFKNKNSKVVGRSTGNTGSLLDYDWEVIGNIYENEELLNGNNP